MHCEDVRLKIHVVLETTDGERIAEIRNSRVLRDAFTEYGLRTAEAAIIQSLDTHVLSPARYLIRAHVSRLLDRVGYTRRGTTAPGDWPNDSAITEALNAKLAAVMHAAGQ